MSSSRRAPRLKNSSGFTPFWTALRIIFYPRWHGMRRVSKKRSRKLRKKGLRSTTPQTTSTAMTPPTKSASWSTWLPIPIKKYRNSPSRVSVTSLPRTSSMPPNWVMPSNWSALSNRWTTPLPWACTRLCCRNHPYWVRWKALITGQSWRMNTVWYQVWWRREPVYIPPQTL